MTSLRHKLWFGFGGLLAVLVVVSALSVIVLTRYSHVLEQLFHENYNSVAYCDAMKQSLDGLNSRAQQLIWQEQTARQIDATPQQRAFADNLALQLANCTLPDETPRSQRLADLWNQYQTRYQLFDDGPAPQRPTLYRDDLLPRYQQIKQAAQQIGDMNLLNMVSVDGEVKRTLTRVRNALLLLAVTGTLIAFVVVSAVAAAILRPLKSLTESARQVESGNLDLLVPVASRDEIGQLAEAFNAMSSKLREFRQLDHERLARTQQTTQLAIDSLPDAGFVIGPNGVVELSNRTARRLFGIEPGRTVAALSMTWLTPLYDQVCRTGKPVDPVGYQSAIQIFEDGRELFLLPRGVPMFAPGGAIIGVTVILVDVTRLHGADEAKSSLVSTVSHELRTPLTSIRMALSLLSGDKFGPLSPKQTQLLNAASEDSERLFRIVENLLSISRIEAGQAQFTLRPMAPQDIIAQAADPIRPAMAEKKIQFDIEIPTTLPLVLADPAVISSALSNLLSNALKFTPPGGRVRIAAAADGQWVAFSVSDTGPGVPPQYARRIFDRFFRVPHPDGPTGAGLGLSIAREVIEAHGGTIELRGSGSEGSTFRFTLRQCPTPADIRPAASGI